MNITPAVSVVVPCYNAAPFLRETIDSVLSQTRPALEVIVIDDGSTDDSAAIAQSYGPPVRVIRQANQGESVARNRGMDEAQGDWIGLLDADDRWVPHKLERQLGALGEASPDVVCVYSDFVLFGSVERRVVRCPPWPVETERRVRMFTNPWIHPSSVLVPKVIGQRVRFPVHISHAEDQVFCVQLLGHGSFLHVPEPLIEYRKCSHQQSAQRGHGIRVIASFWSWIREHPEAFNAAETALVRRLFAEMLVGGHDEAFWRKDTALVEQARALYSEVAPASEPSPPLFERGSPTWVMHAAYHAWNVVLNTSPPWLRETLVRVSRRTIDRLKRGRAVKKRHT
jgi:glycosyltransferase involved in cell wall biosynthesis